MDWIRSAYATKMRFSDDPLAPLVDVQWYFVDDVPPDRVVWFPGPTVFCSANWETNRDVPDFQGTGEVFPDFPSRPWRNGRRPWRGNRNAPCGTPSQFLGFNTWPWVQEPIDGQNRPICCNAGQAAFAGLHAGVGVKSSVSYFNPTDPICFDGSGFGGAFTAPPLSDLFNGHNELLAPLGPGFWTEAQGAGFAAVFDGPTWQTGNWTIHIQSNGFSLVVDATWGGFPSPPVLPFEVAFAHNGTTPITPADTVPGIITLYSCGSPPPPQHWFSFNALAKSASMSSVVTYSTAGRTVLAYLNKVASLTSAVSYVRGHIVSALTKTLSMSSVVTYVPVRNVTVNSQLRKTIGVRLDLARYAPNTIVAGSLLKKLSMSSVVTYP